MTQRELAAQLGLSYATLSRVFNGDSRVTEATRQRVLAEAERLGFRGHALARALRLKRTFGIGVVTVNSPHRFWSDVLAAMERTARASGYHVVLCHRENGLGSAAELRFLLDRQVDAVLLSPHPTEEDMDLLNEIREHGPPLLLFNNYLPGFTCPFIGTDGRGGSRKACEYLLGLGHRRILYAAGPAGNSAADTRLAGYRDAMRAAGIPEAEQQVREVGWLWEEGEAAVPQVLALTPRPTAIMAVNDAAAIGLSLGLRRAGLRIPEDISIVGYSGDPMGELLPAPLTTVRQAAEPLGRRATELVLELIESPRPIFEELEDHLLIRESCGAQSGR